MRLDIACPTCRGKGSLPIGEVDRVECPDCDARGRVPVNEFRVRRRERLTFLPGLPRLRTLSHILDNW